MRSWTYSAQISEPLVFTDIVSVPVEVMPDLNCPAEDIETPTTNGELALNYRSLIDWRASCLNSIKDEADRLSLPKN